MHINLDRLFHRLCWLNFHFQVIIDKRLWSTNLLRKTTSSFTLSNRRWTPAISEIMLLFDIITPLGSPVVPLVYMIVEMSLFFFIGRSKCWFSPCLKQTPKIWWVILFSLWWEMKEVETTFQFIIHIYLDYLNDEVISSSSILRSENNISKQNVTMENFVQLRQRVSGKILNYLTRVTLCRWAKRSNIILTRSKNSSQENISSPYFSNSSFRLGATLPKLTIATNKQMKSFNKNKK